jgi:hypothetical protein
MQSWVERPKEKRCLEDIQSWVERLKGKDIAWKTCKDGPNV